MKLRAGRYRSSWKNGTVALRSKTWFSNDPTRPLPLAGTASHNQHHGQLQTRARAQGSQARVQQNRTSGFAGAEADEVKSVQLGVVALVPYVRHAGDAERGREDDPAAVERVGCVARHRQSQSLGGGHR